MLGDQRKHWETMYVRGFTVGFLIGTAITLIIVELILFF